MFLNCDRVPFTLSWPGIFDHASTEDPQLLTTAMAGWRNSPFKQQTNNNTKASIINATGHANNNDDKES